MGLCLKLVRLLDLEPPKERSDLEEAEEAEEDARRCRRMRAGSTSRILAMRANRDKMSTIDTKPERFPVEVIFKAGDGVTEESLVTKSRCAFVARSFWIVYKSALVGETE